MQINSISIDLDLSGVPDGSRRESTIYVLESLVEQMHEYGPVHSDGQYLKDAYGRDCGEVSVDWSAYEPEED